MITTLVIPDAHADPDHPNHRFDALGNFIVDRQPECIVQIGDWGSYDSVTFHTTGKPLLREGKRLIDDINAAKDALRRMEEPVQKLNDWQKNLKKKQYKPRKWWLNGNHEDRIYRNIVIHPELLGLIDHKDIVNADAYDWLFVPFRGYINIAGTQFTHVPMNKRNGFMPLSGEYVAKRAAELHNSTIVFGHTHRFLVHDFIQIGQQPHQAINVGWFGDYTPSYVTNPDSLDWWSGLLLLHHYAKGKVDIETISMERLKNDYL